VEFNRAIACVVRRKVCAAYPNGSAFCTAHGIPQPTLSNLLNAKHSPTLAVLQRIGGALGTSASELVREAEELSR
jgi:transcriptional regulator with XRE-family HTH domain